MKKFKKLIPAFCMLLISAVLMGTSTFAWFSMNSEVTAGALTIKATTDANLFIANGASVELDAIIGTSVDNLNVSANAVKPCELTDADGTVTVKDVATYTTNPTVSTAGTAATYTNIGTITNTAKMLETMWLLALLLLPESRPLPALTKLLLFARSIQQVLLI